MGDTGCRLCSIFIGWNCSGDCDTQGNHDTPSNECEEDTEVAEGGVFDMRGNIALISIGDTGVEGYSGYTAPRTATRAVGCASL